MTIGKNGTNWIVDDDGDVFLEGMGVHGKVIDPKHIARSGRILMYFPPLDSMAPPEKKTMYVDVEGLADRYPHACPRCGGAAYVGLFSIDCMKKDCT